MNILVLIMFMLTNFIEFSMADGYTQKNSGVNQENLTEISVLFYGRNRLPWSFNHPAVVDHNFYNMVLGQILQLSPNYELLPGLVSEWDYDFSNESYLLKLRDNLKFHNGRKVTSKDLEFSIARGFFSKNRSVGKNWFDNIEGSDKILPGTPYKSGLVSGIRIVDELTLSVRLSKPNPSFLSNLAHSIFSIVPMEEIESDLYTWKNWPIGAGAFKVTSVNDKDFIVTLENTEKNKAKSPKIIRFLVNDKLIHEADFITGTVENPNTKKYKKIINEKYNLLRQVYFNHLIDEINTHKFKEAITLSIERARLPIDHSVETPAFELLPEQYWGRANLKERFNKNRAKEIFATLPEQVKNKKLKICIDRNQKPSSEFIFSLRKQLEDTGFKTDDPSEISIDEFPKKCGDSHLILGLRALEVIDPLALFASSRNGTYVQGLFPVNDPGYEKLYQNAANARDFISKSQAVSALSKYFIENNFSIPITFRKTVYFSDGSKIKSIGPQFSSRTLFFDRFLLEK